MVGANHVLGATVYSPPSGPTYGPAAGICADLLEVLTHNLIYGSSGLRFLAGDLNRDSDSLQVLDHWRQAGWEEAQVIAAKRYGQMRVPTSKGVAFSDHLWLSPELIALLDGVHVFEEIFGEHAVVTASFALPAKAIPQWHWPSPAQFPCNRMNTCIFDTPVGFNTTSFRSSSARAFASWSASTEGALMNWCRQQKVQLPRGCQGRGQTLKPIRRPSTLLPPRSARCGEETMRSAFLNRSVHAWF